MNPEKSGVEIEVIRGDFRDKLRGSGNKLRLWGVRDIAPRPDDVFQERLYCVQWTNRNDVGRNRQETFFASASKYDINQEGNVKSILEKNILQLQIKGLVPDMPIESGKENEGPIRTNGWRYWHNLFMPRSLLTASIIAAQDTPLSKFMLFKYVDNNSKSCRWAVSQSGGDGGAKSTFDSQTLKTIFNWANRSINFTPWLLEINDREPVFKRTRNCLQSCGSNFLSGGLLYN